MRFVLLALPLVLRAQSSNASITGLVDDPAKAAIPDAKITVLNTDTGVRTSVTTNREGGYAIPELIPGPYRVEVEKLGFKTIINAGLILRVQDNVQLNFHMAVGSRSESISVQADAINVDTTDASVSTVIDRQFVENLPLNGRTFQSLIYLTPGVALGVSSYMDGQFSVNGQRGSSNYWMVDGVSANIGQTPWCCGAANGTAGAVGGFSAQGGTNSLVSVDALQEFRIQTSTYAPEFGRTPGGQISIVTRSGTNRLHGTLFDYFRNTVLDAKDWFASAQNLPKAAEQQDDFGGVLGGPVIKDKTFFFFSYEGLRLQLPQTLLTTVPDWAARQNAMPAVRPYLDAFPLPNPGVADVGPGYAPFNASFSNPNTLDAYSIRIDHAITKGLNLFGRYNYSPSASASRGDGGRFALSNVLTATINTNTITVGVTGTKSSKVANEIRFNYSSSGGPLSAHIDTFGGAAVPPTGSLFPSHFTLQNSSFVYDLGFGTSMDYFEGLDAYNLQHQFNVVEILSVHKGSHSLKFGLDYRRLSPINNAYSYDQGAYFTSIAAAEVGATDNNSTFSHTPITFLFHNLGAFAQDTWRVGPRLTLTYGLRWDVDFKPTTEKGPSIPGLTGFSLTDLSNLTLAPVGTPAYNTRYGNVAPRIGGAYQISQRAGWNLVLRGGFGIFYDLASSEVGNLNFFVYPFGAFASFNGAPFPLPALEAGLPTIVPPNATQGTLQGFDPHLNTPYTLEWSLTLEQALGKSQAVTACYIGSSGRRLLLAEALTSPNPSYTAADLIGSVGSSNYNALQVQFQRRLSGGLQTLASYTWSHSIDTGSYGAYADGSLANLNANRADSDFDIRNAFSAALTYDVPTVKLNAFTKTILGGWSAENIFQVRSAPPVTVIDGAFAVLSEENSSIVVRPDVVQGQPLYLSGTQYPGGKALNPNAFNKPPIDHTTGDPARQGDLGRNSLRGFGLAQWDFAMHRDFPIREGMKLQLRAEMFNILNHPNFGLYNNQFGISDPYFGQSTAMLAQSLAGQVGLGGLSPQYQLGGTRSIQLALKLVF